MILKQSDKENRTSIDIRKRIEGLPKYDASQKSFKTLQPTLVSHDKQNQSALPQAWNPNTSPVTKPEQNSTLLQLELNKLKDAYDNQRKQKWNISQEKLKLENQVKVWKIQRDTQYNDNQKLRAELKALLLKLTQVQTQSSNQLSDYYSLKNQNANLLIQLNRYRETDKFSKERTDKYRLDNSQLQAQTTALNTQITTLINDCRIKDTQIDFLRRSINQLQLQNRVLYQKNEQGVKIKEQQFTKICKQLENWKNAFEKKEQQLERRTQVLQQQRDSMQKSINQLTTSLQGKPTSGRLLKTCSLADNIQKNNNQLYVRLFVKQNKIQKLTQNVQQLEQKIQDLTLQNALLRKKMTQNTFFSASGYQKYTQVQNSILKASVSKKQSFELKMQVQQKQQEVQCLVDKISQLSKQLESSIIQLKKLEAETHSERIGHQNTVAELQSKVTKLQRQLEQQKTKMEKLGKQCQEKDRIILTYVNKQKV